MSAVKREAEAFQERLEDLRNLLAEKAATIDPDHDDADKHTYAIAFNGWLTDRIQGTAEEIFEAAKYIIENPLD
jgi:hypothetical protein